MSKIFSNGFPRRVSSITPLFLLISLLFCVSSQNVEKKLCQTQECLTAAKYFKDAMNSSVDPCEDFYKFACGNWARNNTDDPQSVILSRLAKNEIEILDFLKQNNSNDEPEAVHKARKLFSVCKNERAYQNNLDQIEKTLQKIGIPIDSLYSNRILKYDYTTALAKAAKLTDVNLYFYLEIISTPFNQTADTISLEVEPDSTADEQDRFEKITKLCANTSPTCEKLLKLLNFTKNSTTEKTEQKPEISESDTESNSTVNSPLPVLYSLKQLQTLTDDIAVAVNTTIPKFNWTRYIEELFNDKDNVTLDFNDVNKPQITIADLDSVKDMIQHIYKKENTNIIAYELLREVIYTLQPSIDSSGKTEEYCSEQTVRLFDWAVSYMYTQKEKYVTAKIEVPKMIERLREVFLQLILQASWMDEKTRQRAFKKMQLMRPFAVYPSTLPDPLILDILYKNVTITDNFFESRYSNNYGNLGKDDRFEKWLVAPTTVNAYNLPTANSIYIPASILGFPFYIGLEALRYGTIGSIVGHEMAHTLDNQGRGYNETGGVEDWWDPETEKLFQEKARCFVQSKRNYSEAYNKSISKQPSYLIKASLGEDLSDNVGFKESLLAYRKCVSIIGEEPLLPQFENFSHEQLLTLAYANLWCEKPSDSVNRADEHSAAEYRVNGVLQNSDEFSKIWKCPKGSKMNPNSDKCEVW